MNSIHPVLAWLQPEDPHQLDQFSKLGGSVITWVSIGIAAMLCAAFWNKTSSNGAIVLWFVVLLLIRLGLNQVGTAYFRAAPQARAANPYWPLIAVCCAALSSLAWGAGGLILVAPQDVFAEAVLHLVFVAIVTVPAATHANYYPALVVHVLGLLVPLALRDAWIGGITYLALAVISVLAAAYMLLNGWQQSKAIVEAMRQRRRNAQLIEALRRENENAHQARLAAEQANAAKSRLFAAANHDLRQPLHAIGLLAYALRTQGNQADVQELARTISECVHNMSALVDELIELSKLDAGSRVPDIAPFALQDLLRELENSYAPLATAKGLGFEVDATQAVIMSDRTLVTRALSNLISNAIRYTTTGQVQVQVQAGDAQLQVTVQDSGIGIEAQEHTRIFEEFYQIGNPERDRSKGLGLGLATVKRVSDLLGLQVQVHSAPGQGSAFSLHLPLALPDAVHSVAATLPHTDLVLLTGLQVLLIEDDVAARRATGQLLRSWGCTVHESRDGQAALEAVQTGLQPGFILTDLRLSGALHGLAALQALRSALQSEVPGLIVTGDHRSPLIAQAEAADITVLPKPADAALLHSLLKQGLEESQAL